MPSSSNISHLGLIMDGNRRSPKANGKQTIDGHRAGYKNLKELLRTVKKLGLPYVSVYAFSTENWNRSKEEVEGLMTLLRWVLKSEMKDLIKEELRIVFVGSDENVPDDISKLMKDVEEKSSHFTNGTLAICFNYGGQQEVVDAVNYIIESGKDVSVDEISKNLYAPEVPPADLIIRTSGEHRLSNYMMWRSTYAELHFTDTLWPDFSGAELESIVNEFNERNRRFGQ